MSKSNMKVELIYNAYDQRVETLYSYGKVIAVRTTNHMPSANVRGYPNTIETQINTEQFEYSKTTMKHLAKFLGHGIEITRRRIKSGEYITYNE